MKFDFASLRRWPDVEAQNLLAHDASDRMILEEGAKLAAVAGERQVTVIGDRYGALTLGANALLGAARVRVYQDGLINERALKANAERVLKGSSFEHHPLNKELLRDSKLVLLQLPKSVSELREIADAIARWAHKDVAVVAAGRVKHMTPKMNETLKEYFAEVQASLAKQKSRAIISKGLKRPHGEPPFPVWGSDPDLNFEVASFGATFGGATLDHGTRLLLKAFLPALELKKEEPLSVVDVGCGNGSIAVSVATKHPTARVYATDQAQSAVKATVLTALQAGVAERVETIRTDACEDIPAGSCRVALINPPFHTGASVNDKLAERIFSSAAHALSPGGEAWIVFNSHLGYKSTIKRIFGRIETVARDKKFTVIKAIKS